VPEKRFAEGRIRVAANGVAATKQRQVRAKLYAWPKKRTKADKFQRNVERLEKRDDAGRDKSAVNDKGENLDEAAARTGREATKK